MVENYLVLAFAVAVTFALAYPVPGRFLVKIVVLGNVHIIQVSGGPGGLGWGTWGGGGECAMRRACWAWGPQGVV